MHAEKNKSFLYQSKHITIESSKNYSYQKQISSIRPFVNSYTHHYHDYYQNYDS